MTRPVVAVAVASLVTLVVAAPVLAHRGGDPNYESSVTAIAPVGAGVTAEVIDRDDRIVVRNRGSRMLLVEGYNGEPYVRIEPDGTVSINRRSPATYLNEDRFGDVEVPAIADENAEPDWRRLDRSGAYEWHDHRIHWMAKRRPERVKDPGTRTRIFEWRLPVAVAGRGGAISGTLDWVPTPGGGGPPAGAIVIFGLVAVGGLALVVIARRRRRSRAGGPPRAAW